MSQNALLEEKIIRLVLSELGHPVEGERLLLLSQDPSLTEEIMRLKSGLRALHRVYLRGLAKVITTQRLPPRQHPVFPISNKRS